MKYLKIFGFGLVLLASLEMQQERPSRPSPRLKPRYFNKASVAFVTEV